MSASDDRLDAVPPEAPVGQSQAAANRRLGLILGGGVLVLIQVLIQVFRSTGLPKDPDVWRALHPAEPASASAPSATATPATSATSAAPTGTSP